MVISTDIEVRLAALEQRDTQRQLDHQKLDSALITVASDVSSMKRALWFISGALAYNLPVIQELFKKVL